MFQSFKRFISNAAEPMKASARAKFRDTLVVHQQQTSRQPIETYQAQKNRLIIHINARRNNTLCALTEDGNVRFSASAGTCGLKKAARGTSDAGYQAMLQLVKKAGGLVGNRDVQVWFKGFGKGRDACWRALRAEGIAISRVCDLTPIRHGGCRPKKKRRI